MGRLLEINTLQTKKEDGDEAQIDVKINQLILNNRLGKLLQAAYILPLIAGIAATTIITAAVTIAYLIPFLATVKTSKYLKHKIQTRRYKLREKQHNNST